MSGYSCLALLLIIVAIRIVAKSRVASGIITTSLSKPDSDNDLKLSDDGAYSGVVCNVSSFPATNSPFFLPPLGLCPYRARWRSAARPSFHPGEAPSSIV
jgi:hypothetical protein